jgi:hypothetical protein
MNTPRAVAGLAAAIAGVAVASIALQEQRTGAAPSDDAATAMPAASSLPGPVSAAARPEPAPLVRLDVEVPRYNPKQPLPLMFSSGWPIVFKATTSQNALGIAMDMQPSEFPTLGESGYVVFADPDGCLALPEPFVVAYGAGSCPPYNPDPDGNPDTPPPPEPRPDSDEVYLEFANDTDQVGVDDDAGHLGRSAALGDPATSGEPRVREFNGTVAGNLRAVGPATGGTSDDGVGYGADDDLPGLVLLSPHGVGIVFDGETFNRVAPLTQRNLAGFLDWVGYELRAATGTTIVHAGMVVPYGLVAPLMQSDDCIGDAACDDPARYRLDGGPLVVSTNSSTFQFNYPPLFQQVTYELRAFLVSGVAPSQLADANGDGVVTAADAQLAGHAVISNEVVFRLRQFHGNYCGGISFTQQTFFADFDGNGMALGTIVCPAGPGLITRPPN